MPTIVKPICLAGVLLVLGACSRLGGGQDEMSWARQALERNGRVQVVASDPQARTFTVRVKDTGELVVVPVDQLVAGPASLFSAAATAGSATSAGTAESAAPLARSATEASQVAQPDVDTSAASGSASPPLSTTGTGAPSTGATAAGGSDRRALAAAGEAAEAPGAATATDSSPGTVPGPADAGATADSQVPHAASAANAKAGSVLASGPGYSIKAAGSKPGSSIPSPATAPRGAPERLHDPIICQGARLLHIDNRNLEFDGDGIAAEDGCEIHITNSHVRAKGIGVQARAANVHIQNSEIDGDSGAVDASDGAQIYAQSSRFKGLTRRLESSAFHDLGGNVWN
jgi:hypothetical protein